MHLCTPPHTKLSFSHTLDVHREFVTYYFYSFIVFYYCLLDNDNYDNEKLNSQTFLVLCVFTKMKNAFLQKFSLNLPPGF